MVYSVKDGEKTVEITNVAYELIGMGVPGRPEKERLILRGTTWSKEVLGDIPTEATVTFEAWPLGADLKGAPIYKLALDGRGGHAADNGILVVDRGVEEVAWWSVFQLGTGRHLFDTYVPLLTFSITEDVQTLRYAGLEVPPDDASDARLRNPRVVGVLTYASAERVIREALLTCDDPVRATELRSYADTVRTVTVAERPRAVRISFAPSIPGSAPAPVELTVAVAGDDLDLSRVKPPTGLHVAAWRRERK